MEGEAASMHAAGGAPLVVVGGSEPDTRGAHGRGDMCEGAGYASLPSLGGPFGAL